MSEIERKKRKKWPWIVSGFGIIVSVLVIYGVMIYSNLTETAKEMHEPIDRTVSEKREEAVAFGKQEPFSLLVLGVDEREDDKGRSDTIIVMTVNPELKSTKMVSIPRDTYTEIAGKNFKDKINHAYAFGGIEMSMATVENLLDIPIDYIVQVNMDSFKDIVDAFGGIKINNTLDFTVGSTVFPKGDVSLNGEEALSFVRMRYEDPRGDFGRQDRQKQVIQAVLSQGASLNSLLNYKSIFSALGNNIKTNMTFEEMVEVQKNYKDAAKNVEQIYINEGIGEMKSGIWYYIMNETELENVQNELKMHLEM
ncbi:LCP family glycopolymer transferase [Sporosarcina sp. CAU 1771]